MGYNGSTERGGIRMNPERAPSRNRRDASPGAGGQLLRFREPRAFGPLSWRTVRMASVVVLLLLLGGAILELFLWRLAREPRTVPPREARVPS